MTDIAELGIAIKTTGAKEGKVDLDKLAVASKSAEAAAAQLTAAMTKSSGAAQKASATAGVYAAAMKAQAAAEKLAATQAAASIRRIENNARQLSYQLIDIGQTIPLAFQSPIYALQNLGFQIAQISQLYIGNGGLGAAVRDVGGMLGGFVGKVWPVAAAGAALWGAYELVAYHMRAAGGAVSDATRALADQAGTVDQVRGSINALQQITDEYARAIRGTAKDQSIATASILANSEKEFNAKKSLLELELRRQQAAIAVQQLERANAGRALREEVAKGTVGAGVANDVAGGYADPAIGAFVRSPARDALLQRTRELIEASPLNAKIKELTANIDLAEVSTSLLEEALKTTFGDSVATSIGRIATAAKTGKTDAEKAAERYADMIRSGRQFIAAQALERQALFMSAEAASALRYEQEMLHRAANDNYALEPKQRDEISLLAKEMAAAEAQTVKWSRAMDQLADAAQTALGSLMDLTGLSDTPFGMGVSGALPNLMKGDLLGACVGEIGGLGCLVSEGDDQ